MSNLRIDPKVLRERIDNFVTVVAARVRLLEEQEVGTDANQRWRLALAWVMEMETLRGLAQLDAMQELARTLYAQIMAEVADKEKDKGK